MASGEEEVRKILMVSLQQECMCLLQQYLDALCNQLYESVDSRQRAAAERALAEFSERPDSFQKSMLMLERGSSPYTQLVASTTLTKLISKPSASISLEERHDLSKYLVRYLGSRQKLPNFVVTSLCQLFARLTKLGWFDFNKQSDFLFRDTVEEIVKMVQENMEVCRLGFQLLAHVVAEMNQVPSISAIGSITKHRKVAASFRDVQLLSLFQLSIQFLQTAADSINKLSMDDENQLALINNLLELAQNCLNYDFIGSIIDDTADDNFRSNIHQEQLQNMKVVSVFVDNSVVKLFYQLYASLPPGLSSKSLSCLVQLSSIRRTIFNNTERQDFLSSLVTGAKTILENPQGLSDQSCYHEFCRLVARLKANYQLTELIKVPEYEKVIRGLAEFTVQSLQMHSFAANSIHYLMSFWQRMVSSMPYVKATEPHLLENFAPLVAKAYIDSRLSLVAAVVSEGIEDPLEDKTSVGQQLDQFSVIGRCDYEQTCRLVLQIFETSAKEYQKALGQQPREQELQEGSITGRLTWLVFIAGSAIGGRVAFSTSEEHDIIDGDLICRVLELMTFTDERLPSGNSHSEKLEMSFMWFLEQFRKIYISDQVQRTSKVYAKLSESLGLTDEAMVLGVFIRKIITNLKYWSGSERLVEETLGLLNDLSVGYTSVRKLVRLPEVQFLMNNHTSDHFSFLGTQSNLRTMKCRTTFYTALTRLLCVDVGEDSENFDRFMTPITSAMAELSKIFGMADSIVSSQNEAKMAVIGLARDLRGVAYASNTKNSYALLFDWMYPNNLNVFLRAVEIWYGDPDVTTPVLKLMCELCQNRSQRLQFDFSSANAILLFKEASKLLCAYGTRVLSQPSPKPEDLYRARLKGATVCFGILKAAMCGCYVNFGVFRLYGDTCLDDALEVFVKLLVSIPKSDLLAYPKLGQNYYFLLECLAQDQQPFISNLEPQIFAYILDTIRDGLMALVCGQNTRWGKEGLEVADTMICTSCCSCLDMLVSYLYKRVSRAGKPRHTHAGMPPEGTNCLRMIELHPEILRNLLSTMLNAIIFEECRCQWSMSRPLLGLILLQEESFHQLKSEIIATQPPPKQAAMNQCFFNLMEDVERNLSVKNKDRFTQNLAVFRRDITEALKNGSGPSAAASAAGGGGDNMVL